KSMSKEDREVYKNYSLNQNKEGLKSLINIDVEKEESKQNSMYTEEPTSRLAHIKGKASYIYKTPKNSTETQSADKWKNSVYYVKKRATHNGKKYYLLSNEPSAVEGVVGWIETTDVIHRRHLFIEDDPKVFVINGIGSAYIHPWGGSDNIVISDLQSFKGVKFYAKRTEKVGEKFWYYGKVDGSYIWLETNQLDY